MGNDRVILKGKEITKVLSMPGCPNVKTVWSILANKLFFELVLIVDVRFFWLKSATLTMNGHSISDFSFAKVTQAPFKIALGNVPAQICCTDLHGLNFEVLVEGKVLCHDTEPGSEVQSKASSNKTMIEQVLNQSSVGFSQAGPQIRPAFLRPDQSAVVPAMPSCTTICSHIATLNAAPEDPKVLDNFVASRAPEVHPSPRRSPVEDARLVESFISHPISENIFNEKPNYYFGLSQPVPSEPLDLSIRIDPSASQRLDLSIRLDPSPSPAPKTALISKIPPLMNLESRRNVDFGFLACPNHLQWRPSNPVISSKTPADQINPQETSENKIKSSSFQFLKDGRSCTYTVNLKDGSSVRDLRSMNYQDTYSLASEAPSMGLLKIFFA